MGSRTLNQRVVYFTSCLTAQLHVWSYQSLGFWWRNYFPKACRACTWVDSRYRKGTLFIVDPGNFAQLEQGLASNLGRRSRWKLRADLRITAHLLLARSFWRSHLQENTCYEWHFHFCVQSAGPRAIAGHRIRSEWPVRPQQGQTPFPWRQLALHESFVQPDLFQVRRDERVLSNSRGQTIFRPYSFLHQTWCGKPSAARVVSSRDPQSLLLVQRNLSSAQRPGADWSFWRGKESAWLSRRSRHVHEADWEIKT